MTGTAAPPPVFGDMVEAFLRQALPPNTHGHVLAVGEEHSLTDHIQALRADFPSLRDPATHNVGTLGLEMRTYENVLFWAMQDGNLPVAKGKERAYLEAMFEASAQAEFAENTREHARLAADMLQTGGGVVAFDARETLAQKMDGKEMSQGRDPEMVSITIAVAKKYWPASENARRALREDPRALEQWAKDASSRSFYVDEQGHEVPLSQNMLIPTENLTYVWHLLEIENLLKAHPAYQARLEKMEAIIHAGRAKGLTEDAQSAAVFAAFADPERNNLTISGADHVRGAADRADRVQGTFAEHLKGYGLTVTPSIFASSRDRKEIELSHSDNNACAARAPMHLVMTDKDAVLDVSSPAAIWDGLKRDMAWDSIAAAVPLIARGAHLTCDDPQLPTVAECAKREAEGKGSCGR